MLETLLFFALGFAVAGLIALAALPAVWARALRLTRRRIEVDVPLSMAEVRAGRDEERAVAAIAVRRIERAFEAEREKRHLLMAEVGRQQMLNRRLAAQAGEMDRLLSEKDAEIDRIRQSKPAGSVEIIPADRWNQIVAPVREVMAAAAPAPAHAAPANDEALTELRRLADAARSEADDLRMQLDSLRTEAVAARMKADTLDEQIASNAREAEKLTASVVERDSQITVQKIELSHRETAIALLESRLTTANQKAVELTQQLAEKKSEIASLEVGQQELERRLMAMTAQMMKADSALAEKTAKLAIATAREGELMAEVKRLRSDAQRTAVDLAQGIDAMRGDQSHMAAQLEAARADRALLVKEISILKKEAAEGWKTIESENQTLRFELARIAAQIAEDAAARRGVIVPPPSELAVANDDLGRRARRKKNDERADTPQG